MRNLKKAKVIPDLWKPRFDHLKKANYHAKEITAINFCHADVNCHLRVNFYDEKQEDIFFSTFVELCGIVDCEI